MRLEIELVDGGRGGPAPDLPPVRISPPRRRRLDRFEWSVLLAFAAISMWVVALDLWRGVFDGQVWTGTDGVYIVDQMQYLAWIKDASKHLLASNLFVLRGTQADYFNPAVVVSGGLTALGMAPWLSLLLWKPVAVIGFFFAVRAFVWRLLSGLWPRRAALVLALFARQPRRLVLAMWVATLVLLGPLLIYYVNGATQFGMRHALDFEPFLLVLMAIALRDRTDRAFQTIATILLWYSIIFGFWGLWFWRTFFRPTY